MQNQYDYQNLLDNIRASILLGVCRGRDRSVVEFTTTCAISAYHH